jgi:beta-xylosidase
MWSSLAIGDFVHATHLSVKTLCHYHRDYAQWSALIRKLVKHQCDRYGPTEVRDWFFEVWNEPNRTAFNTGKQSEYFELSRSVTGATSVVQASIQRIDLQHANAKRRWEQTGKPEYLTAASVAELKAASRHCKEVLPLTREGGALRVEVIIPPQSIAAMEMAL